MQLLLGFNVEVLHNSWNTCTHVLPDMYTLIPQACSHQIQVYISGRTYTYVHGITINCILHVFGQEWQLGCYIHTCTNETHSLAPLQDLIPTLAS